jgi:hypothetical protein
VQLEVLRTYELFGNVQSMCAARLRNAERDALFLTFMDAKLSVVEYDPSNDDLKTVRVATAAASLHCPPSLHTLVFHVTELINLSRLMRGHGVVTARVCHSMQGVQTVQSTNESAVRTRTHTIMHPLSIYLSVCLCLPGHSSIPSCFAPPRPAPPRSAPSHLPTLSHANTANNGGSAL